MIIDTTYFVGDINVPLNSKAELNSGINDSISKFEKEVLKSLLGHSLYVEFMTAYDASQQLLDPVTLPAKWDELLNGADFSFDLGGETINEHWVGLKNVEKQSLIAYYVYFMHRRNNESQFTAQGETRSTSENSVMVSPRAKLVNAWNKFIELYGDIEYVGNGLSTYQHENAEPSAYNFLLANKANYSGWRFKPQGTKINILGL